MVLLNCDQVLLKDYALKLLQNKYIIEKKTEELKMSLNRIQNMFTCNYSGYIFMHGFRELFK